MTQRPLSSLFVCVALLAVALPAAAQVSLPTATSRPPLIRHQKATKYVEYRLQISPGVADVNSAATITVALAAVLQKHDARFGTRQPIEDAKLTAYLIPPKAEKDSEKKPQDKGTKGPAPSSIQARVVPKLRDSGRYGFVFTSPVKGVHTLIIKGTSKLAGAISYSVPVSFGVWPIPADAPLAKAPKTLPAAVWADPSHGWVLCKQHCQENLDFAAPRGSVPTSLDSARVATMNDDTLLEAVVGARTARSLTELERRSLIEHLHTLHYKVKDFFPKANRYMVTDFTINDHGLDRLDETAGLALKNNEQSAKVLIVYKGSPAVHQPAIVDFDNTIDRNTLQAADKVGYIIFLKGPTAPLHEVAFGLHLEPTYPISSVLARDQNGKEGQALATDLRTFRGLGRFNDARSLRRGAEPLQETLLPLYLRSAELATMAYKSEREFTAFDDQFSDLD